jgi:hypothetical protein
LLQLLWTTIRQSAVVAARLIISDSLVVSEITIEPNPIKTGGGPAASHSVSSENSDASKADAFF